MAAADRRGMPQRAPTLTVLAAVAILAGILVGCAPQDRGLPKGLPDTVQVVDGVVSNAVTGSGKNWSFTVTVPDAEAQESAVRTLAESGFAEIGRNTSGDTTTVALQNPKSGINATLLLTKRDQDNVVIYNLIKVS